MKTDAGKTETRDLPPGSQRDKPKQPNLHHVFDAGRLDNEIEPPKVLLDVIHVGVAVWGLLLAAGVYFFGGQDWRESLLVLGVFAFFLGAWRIAMIVGAWRKKTRERRAAEAESPANPYVERSPPTASGRDADAVPVDPTAETRPLQSSAESTAAEREYVSRST
ncbi:MAG TPA: hypothetical protein VGN57_03195 [Pirellulaceae bacterium]|nr:hypothetical protein [Pirellulaceae bacterium]